MIDNEKRNSPSNCILPLLPYLTESPILLDSQSSQSSQSANRLVFDSFHSTALEFVTPSQFSEAKNDGLWEKHPTEPSLGDDATPGISDEVVNYLEKQKMDEHATKHLHQAMDSFRDIWADADPAMRKKMKADLTSLLGDMPA